MTRLTQKLLALPFLLLAFATGYAQAEDFLDPEEAFKFSARAVDAQTIEATWKIADGYYLYKDKFKFALTGARSARSARSRAITWRAATHASGGARNSSCPG